MSSVKKCAVLAVAMVALSVTGVASASASTFTASATGTLTGKALETQVFTINNGPIRCAKVHFSGTITSTASPEQKVTMLYTECTAFAGFLPVDNIHAEYNFTANGEVHILNTLTIVVTSPFGTCHITAKPQTARAESYSNSGSSLVITPNITGIVYTTTGGACGSGGSNGTYTGKGELSRVGGGFISWDA